MLSRLMKWLLSKAFVWTSATLGDYFTRLCLVLWTCRLYQPFVIRSFNFGRCFVALGFRVSRKSYILTNFFCVTSQLDLRPKMALVFARSTAKLRLRMSVLGCVGCSGLSNCDSYIMGCEARYPPRPRHHRSCSDHGWHGAFVGLLCRHVVVEDSMAELK